MTPNTHIRQLLLHVLAVAAVAAAALLTTAAPAVASYGWPVKPFHHQHPVRGLLGDPRITDTSSTIHFGIDIPAPDGTPVYATLDGSASIHSLHRDTVIVSGAGGVAHEYWHVIPAVKPGQRVFAYRTVVGYVEAPWKHVHFSERLGSGYLNPLRPGALSPYRDTTKPTVRSITFERDRGPVGTRLSGVLDVVADVFDTTPIPIPAPWHDKPVSPAFVAWRILGPRGATAWRTAVDFRYAYPQAAFSTIYAPWTLQNSPWGRCGRYRYYLARGWDTRRVPNGTYRVVVVARDTAGNEGRMVRTFTVWNSV